MPTYTTDTLPTIAVQGMTKEMSGRARRLIRTVGIVEDHGLSLTLKRAEQEVAYPAQQITVTLTKQQANLLRAFRDAWAEVMKNPPASGITNVTDHQSVDAAVIGVALDTLGGPF